MENKFTKRPVHVGHNIQRYRIIRGLSQAGMAFELEQKRNRQVSQQLISDIEDRETIADEELLKQIAEVLEVSPEGLRHVNLDDVLNVIGNTFMNNDNANFNQPMHSSIHQTVGSIDKLIEFFEKEKAELKNEIRSLRKEVEKLGKRKK